jgi:hypothetical protein
MLDRALGRRALLTVRSLTSIAARLIGVLLTLVLSGCRAAPGAEPTSTPDTTVPGIAFPQQDPVEGMRTYMTAALTGLLEMDAGCLWLRSLHDDSRVLPIWPPELNLRVDDERLVIVNESISPGVSGSAADQVVAVVGYEVHMGGGHVPSVGDSILAQVPDTCQGDYFLVGDPLSVRPNLRAQSELMTVHKLTEQERTVLALHHKPELLEQAGATQSQAGELVLYQYQRCVQLQTGRGPGPVTLLWPLDWAVRVEGGAVQILGPAGEPVARTGESVTLRGRPIVQDWQAEIYRRAVQELPGDCCCSFWLVEGVE